jgi:hypothetical protein
MSRTAMEVVRRTTRVSPSSSSIAAVVSETWMVNAVCHQLGPSNRSPVQRHMWQFAFRSRSMDSGSRAVLA